MKITYLPAEQLISPEYNPRKCSSREEGNILESIKRVGLLQPAVVNTHPERNNIIVGGNQRVRIYLKYKDEILNYWKEHKMAVPKDPDVYPCHLVIFDLETEREANIRLNKNNASWDVSLLAEEFSSQDLLDFGFTSHEIKLNIDTGEDLFEDDETEDEEDIQSILSGHPLSVVLDSETFQEWESWKENNNFNTDTKAFLHIFKELNND